MRKLLARVLATTLILVLLAPPAFAWNDFGHHVIARLAFAELTPQQREKIWRQLKEHPHYPTYLTANRPEGVEEMEWAFLRAATWSDWIRPPKNFAGDLTTDARYKFHRGPWHYVNFPHRLNAQPQLAPTALPAETSVLEQIPLSVKVLRREVQPDPGQAASVTQAQNDAVRLCWLFHLIGDLHQPLHTTALIDEQRFATEHHDDQGGNLLAIRPTADATPIKLHWYWDQMLGNTNNYTAVRQRSDALRQNAALQAVANAEDVANSTARDWAIEGHQLAARYVYLNGKLPLVRWEDFDQKRIAASDVPIMPAEAASEAQELVQKRAILAGKRLARTLAEVANALR